MLKTIAKYSVAGLVPALAAPAVLADETVNTERRIVINVEAPRSLEANYRMWATQEGLETFIAPGAEIDPRVGGKLSVYFNPQRSPGFRGAEDMTILSLEAPERISFTWNAPVMFPHARSQRTVVTLRFTELGENRTKVSLTQDHFGHGHDWDETFEYFIPGWGAVMARFAHAAENGAINWSDYADEDGGVNWSKMGIKPVDAIVTR